jgi:uncharacterized membrane protein YidH (DUF202 family)
VSGPSTSERRTRLARARTALGFVVLGVFLLRQGASRHSWLDLSAGLLALASACVSAARPGPRTLRTVVRRPRLLVASVLVISCLALVGALIGRP